VQGPSLAALGELSALSSAGATGWVALEHRKVSSGSRRKVDLATRSTSSSDQGCGCSHPAA
jgi:hypothetical protein